MEWEFLNTVFGKRILLVIIITLLPLIPAFILFKFLPSKSIVGGPFKGLQVDFSGATAIYFVLFLTLFAASQVWKIENKNFKVWHVQGKLKIESTIDMSKNFEIFVSSPPDYDISPDGNFSIDILSKKGEVSGEMELPTLQINSIGSSYMTRYVNLDDDSTIRKISPNTIEIRRNIELYKEDSTNH